MVLGHGELRVVFHAARDGARFFRVLEASDGVELDFFDEVEQVLVVLIGFAGEPGDEGGADRHAGDALAELVAELGLVGAGDIAAHAFEHAIGPVLEGDVEVGQEVALVGELGEGVDDLVGEVGRVGVHHAQPPAPDLFGDGGVEVAEELGQTGAELVVAGDLSEPDADVVAVACGVLPDHEEFVGAVAHELAGFFDDAVFGLGAHLASDGGDGAEGAVLVAPL